MNRKKILPMLALLTAFGIYANAQVETNVTLSINDQPETQYKSAMDVSDKGFGQGAKVPDCEPGIVDENDAPQLYWSVYPNPTNSNLVLWVKNLDSLKLEVNMTYRLYDVNGNMLMDEKVEGERTSISVDILSPSVYYLSVLTKKSIKSFKIIKY